MELAWHFVADTLLDGRPVPEDGVALRHEGGLVMCESGLHASRELLDAIRYAPGATVCRVKCEGTIIEDRDKLVCSRRTILWRIDASDLLAVFARLCALDVIHLWNPPEVVLDFLRTGNKDLSEDATTAAAVRAAETAAWAAEAAAWSAAWAAETAAWAAEAAVRAAKTAAWAAEAAAAAVRAAETAAWAAEAAEEPKWTTQNARLTELIIEAREALVGHA